MAAKRAVASFAPSSLNLHFLRHSINPILIQEFNYDNVRQIPKLSRIVVKYDDEETSDGTKDKLLAAQDLALITGQMPTLPPPSAISKFATPTLPLDLSVTLKREMAHSFLERLINLGLPRLIDFQGRHPTSFDGKGTCILAFRDHNVFGELRDHFLSKPRALDVHLRTTAKTDIEAQRLLALLGMPFEEGGEITKWKKKKISNLFDPKGKRKAQK